MQRGGNQGGGNQQDGSAGDQQQGTSGGQGGQKQPQQKQPQQQSPDKQKPKEKQPTEEKPKEKPQQKNRDPGNMGAVRDATTKDGQVASEADKKQMEEDWKIAVAQAARQQKTCGNLPGELQKMVDEIVNPTVDWRELLRRFVNERAREDYSWFPPNRRYVGQGIYLPSTRSEKMGEMVLGYDSSGSVGRKETNQFAGETSSIVEENGAHVTVIYCDTRVANVEEFGPDDMPIELNPRGGGGTDFRPVFDYVEEHDLEPACLIYFTDGYCNSFPKEEPAYPVLWACTRKGFEPPFGEVIEVIATD